MAYMLSIFAIKVTEIINKSAGIPKTAKHRVGIIQI